MQGAGAIVQPDTFVLRPRLQRLAGFVMQKVMRVFDLRAAIDQALAFVDRQPVSPAQAGNSSVGNSMRHVLVHGLPRQRQTPECGVVRQDMGKQALGDEQQQSVAIVVTVAFDQRLPLCASQRQTGYISAISRVTRSKRNGLPRVISCSRWISPPKAAVIAAVVVGRNRRFPLR